VAQALQLKVMGLTKIERYQRGHPKPEVEDGQTIQWPKEIDQKDKQGKLILSNTIYTERYGWTMLSPLCFVKSNPASSDVHTWRLCEKCVIEIHTSDTFIGI
jgi:hypothetical protein